MYLFTILEYLSKKHALNLGSVGYKIMIGFHGGRKYILKHYLNEFSFLSGLWATITLVDSVTT